MKLLHKANEKARKMKKAFCFNICSRHSLWQNVSMSDLRISKLPRTKKGNLGEHFSASAYGLGFKNFSLGSLFSTSVTWKNLKSDVDKFCLRRGENKYWNKILILSFFPGTMAESINESYSLNVSFKPKSKHFTKHIISFKAIILDPQFWSNQADIPAT